ncbi:MAG: antitoxin family protein [Planctomycetota bacterium]|jgi:predicted DNA-binding antitoxin AbrB/MazE fold protein|nr:antitoxin family protein [Planctomycetota bacterium]
MKTVKAVYEGGVFRPVEEVDLPETCEVEFEPRLVNANDDKAQSRKRISSILSRRFQSGENDVAARHNEHQP